VAEQPVSPFTGLDKALLRSTQRPPATEPEATPSSTRAYEKSNVRTNDRSNERTDAAGPQIATTSAPVRSVSRPNERTRVRHSFDVFEDQLQALTDIQADVFHQTNRKPKVGELVQKALDEYIHRHRRRRNDRSTARPDERSEE